MVLSRKSLVGAGKRPPGEQRQKQLPHRRPNRQIKEAPT